MKKRGMIIPVIIVIVVIALIAFILIKSPFSNNTKLTTVTISDFKFVPSTLNVKIGTTITWNNDDSTLHDITNDAEAGVEAGSIFDIDLEPGMSGEYTFTEAGEYNYHCDIHPSMKGKIVVTE
jgi:plastocyanin